jgi:hypothetical protein
MKSRPIKIMMFACFIAVMAVIPGVPHAINIPPKEVQVVLINQKAFSVQIGCSIGYLLGSTMHQSNVDVWVPAGGTVYRTLKHSSQNDRIFVASTVYYNGKTFRQDDNRTNVKKIIITALAGGSTKSTVMKVDFY